eukprot:jgi/Botrbrau1/20141/Bobra.0173s0043.1
MAGLAPPPPKLPLPTYPALKPELIPIRTPHSGYHFNGQRRRFFEGWYFKVTIPETKECFALIYAVEDPHGSPYSASSAQIMGPDDSYLIQYQHDNSGFWAHYYDLKLGNIFKSRTKVSPRKPAYRMLPEEQFWEQVEHGFQASATWHQGAIVVEEEGLPGDRPSNVSSARWAFSVRPSIGWGDRDCRQRSTAGWLASLPVFEPHWQVVMAKGWASGWIEWKGRRLDFQDAPSMQRRTGAAASPPSGSGCSVNTSPTALPPPSLLLGLFAESWACQGTRRRWG